MKWQRLSAVTLCISTLALAGCGGTSGPGNQNQNQNLVNRSVDTLPDGNTHAEGQSGRVGIFLSATPDGKSPTKTTHLWVNLLKVELIDVQEKPVTVFESQDGISVDLNTLYETSGRRFSLLTSIAVPSGKAYIRARVTFGKAFSVFAADAATGLLTPLADTVPHDDKENPMLSFPLTRPRDLGNGKENLVIDFDLARMQVTDGRITPVLREGDQNGLSDLARQIPTTFVGTIQEWTSSEADKKKAVAAAAGEGTAGNGSKSETLPASSGKGAGKPTLVSQKPTDLPAPADSAPLQKPSDGATVKPTADAAKSGQANSSAVAAPASGPNADKTRTAPADDARSGHVFTLSLGAARSIAIQVSEATVYDNDGAAPNPALSEGKRAAVRGVLDPVTKRILAQRITLLSGDSTSGETTTLRGAVTAIDTKTDLLTLTTTQTEGILPTFASVTVQMTPDAVYRSRGGLLLSEEEFAAALSSQPGVPVAISGVYEPVTGTMRGKTARLEEVIPGAAHEAIITGQGQNVDVAAGTFTLSSPTLWQGITIPTNGFIPVNTTVATVFRDEKGQYLASANFYAAMKEGRSAQVTGLYSKGILTATRLELLPAETKATEAKPAAAKAEGKPVEAKSLETTDGKNAVKESAGKDAMPAEPTPEVKPVPPTPDNKTMP